MTTIVALGAEKQAATSLALGYPDYAIVFVSDCDILDGADLSNANLSGTVGLTQAQLARALCNTKTKLPDGLIGRQDAKE